jgi:hypothetical protein
MRIMKLSPFVPSTGWERGYITFLDLGMPLGQTDLICLNNYAFELIRSELKPDYLMV